MNDIALMYQNISEIKWEDNLFDFLNSVLDYLKIDNWEFSLTLSDNDYIQKMNKDYRKQDKPTDVITFVMSDEPFPVIEEVEDDEFYSAGDIIISLDTVKENAEYFKVEYEEELQRVLIHGILHLKGYDHKTNEPDEEMLVLQEKVLQKLKEQRIF